MEFIDLEIINWDKYNPKRDQQTYTWLRLNNDIVTDPDLFGLTAEQKFVWIEILCQASKKNSGTITVNLQQLSFVTGVAIEKVRELITFLQAKPICRVHDGARPSIVACTTPTNERTNERNNAPSELDSEKGISTLGTKFKPSDTQLQEIYSDFPRKKGRAKGFAKARAEIKSIHDLDDLKAAVSNYRQNCILEKKEPRFILHFSTFMAEWRDWIDPNHGTGEDFSKAQVSTVCGIAHDI